MFENHPEPEGGVVFKHKINTYYGYTNLSVVSGVVYLNKPQHELQ